jgi:sigma-B regulation protein RsbU (phosphoserine phosphatase)
MMTENSTGTPRNEMLNPIANASILVESAEFSTGVLQPVVGDLVLLYTDGVTEAENPAGEQFGREGLEQAAVRSRHLPARELVQALRGELEGFTHQKALEDDATLLVVRITEDK